MVIRISDPARNDLAEILAISSERWGEVGEARYRRQLLAAMRSLERRAGRAPGTDQT
jgi:plasmid stabilization system protein ParE